MFPREWVALTAAFSARNFAVLVAAIGTAWLTWQIVTIGAADFFALSRPELTLRWKPDHAEALIELAQQQLPLDVDTSQQQAISGLARRAMVAAPLEAAPLRLVALIAEASGNEGGARRLMQLAAARSLRDVESQIWLADDEFLRGNFAEAFDRVDVLLRVWPGLGETLFPLLAELAVQPESSAAVLTKLQDGPPWRGHFLTMLPKSQEEPAGLRTFYARLGTSSAPLTAMELRPYLLALIEVGEPSLAHAVWTAWLPDGMRPVTGEIYNGDFEQPVSGLPFDWTIDKVRGAEARVAPYGSGSRALRVDFYNTRVPFRHVSQLLLLQAGSYRLFGDVRVDDLKNERGIQWVVSCASGGEKIGESARFNGAIPWISFEFPFDVPAQEGCETQLLRLELAARLPAEQKVSGQVWFDNLLVEPAASAQF